VNLILLLFISHAVLCGQSTISLPRIGVLDYYGLHKITPTRIQRVLATKEGDPFPASKGDLEERLEQIPGVVRSHLEAVCCDGGKAVLFVGIEERGAAHFNFRTAPQGKSGCRMISSKPTGNFWLRSKPPHTAEMWQRTCAAATR